VNKSFSSNRIRPPGAREQARRVNSFFMRRAPLVQIAKLDWAAPLVQYYENMSIIQPSHDVDRGCGRAAESF